MEGNAHRGLPALVLPTEGRVGGVKDGRPTHGRAQWPGCAAREELLVDVVGDVAQAVARARQRRHPTSGGVRLVDTSARLKEAGVVLVFLFPKSDIEIH